MQPPHRTSHRAHSPQPHPHAPLPYLTPPHAAAGKGSTAVLLSSILRAAGLRVGLYTSPHLHHVTERISTLQGTPIATQQWEGLVHRSRPAIDPLRAHPATCPSHFEVLTALALRYCSLWVCPPAGGVSAAVRPPVWL
jgi:hypothetical protein